MQKKKNENFILHNKAQRLVGMGTFVEDISKLIVCLLLRPQSYILPLT